MTRSSAARLAVHTSWANTADRSARTAAARSGLLEKFRREARDKLGPDASDAQVAAAADSLRKAYYARISRAGVAARKAS